MTTITDYTTLQAAIIEYLGRDQDTTLAARVPTFIQFFEAKMNRELFVPQMEQRSTTTIDTSSTEPEFISLPSDFQTIRRVRLSSATGKPSLDYLSGPSLDEYRSGIGNATGQPRHYTIMGSEIELAPTPDSDYSVEMVYRKNVPSLESNDTNWLLTLAPDLYLYGALMEAEPALKNDGRIQTWALGYSNALTALNRLSAYSGPMTMRLSGVTP